MLCESLATLAGVWKKHNFENLLVPLQHLSKKNHFPVLFSLFCYKLAQNLTLSLNTANLATNLGSVMNKFNKLNLSETIISNLNKLNYKQPTPIQEEAIPLILEGYDILGIAQTGTGKTAAFCLPLIEKLLKNHKALPAYHSNTLILTPTRELCQQIHKSIQKYANETEISSVEIFGGVGMNPQITAMAKSPNIIVATPGRLMDLIEQGKVFLDQIEYFVLDEADQMLDLGFIKAIEKICSLLPKTQTLFFSATMPKAVIKLANQILKQPKEVSVAPPSTLVDLVSQELYYVSKKNKIELLQHLLDEKNIYQALVFAKTKESANRVYQLLKKNSYPADQLHGDMSQNQRNRALEDFKSGKLQVLVATDVAARGIDIPNLSHVVNFEIPTTSESYVHRIGRTARAGQEGIAINFCDHGEKRHINNIEQNTKIKIKIINDHPFPLTNEEISESKHTKKKFSNKRDSFKNNKSPLKKTSKINGKSKHKAKPSKGKRK